MSVLAYFAPVRESRMPRATSQPDPPSINGHGPILEGRLTVRQAFEKIDFQASTLSPDVRSIDSRSRRPI